MKCTVCNHPLCHDIDLAILSGEYTLEKLKLKFGPSMSAFFRHKKHLLEKLAKAEARLENVVRQGCLLTYNTYLEEASAAVKTAREDGNARLSLQAVNAGARILNAMTRLEIKFDPDTTYRLVASPAWSQPAGILPADPHVLAGSRRALARGLFAACPEADPDEFEDIAEEGDDLLPGALAPASAEFRHPEFLGFLVPAPPDLPPAGPAAQPRQKSAKPPKNKREISAKLPKKSPSRAKIIKQYQKDTVTTKNSPKNPFSPGPADNPAAPPAVLTHSCPPDLRPHVGRESGAPPAILTSLPPENPSSSVERQSTAPPAIPTTIPESLFQRLHRQLAQFPAPAAAAAGDAEQLYVEHLRDKIIAELESLERQVATAGATLPQTGAPPPTGSQPPETGGPEPAGPEPAVPPSPQKSEVSAYNRVRNFYDDFAHLSNASPFRKIKGCYG